MQDGLNDSSQQVLIEALPPVLVLHIKRFEYDAVVGDIRKIGKSIRFKPDLEIPLGAIFTFLAGHQRLRIICFVISDIMVPNAQRPPRYKLYGLLYHHGKSAGSGHYTVDVLHPNGDGNTGKDWLHIDDEVVTRIGHKDVFGEHGTERAANERCAYLLFYCRTSSIDTS